MTKHLIFVACALLATLAMHAPLHAADTASLPPAMRLVEARALIEAKDWKGAIQELQRVSDPASADWNNLMGYSHRKAKTPDYVAADGYPYFVQAYGKAAWDAAVRSPITAADVKMAAPEAEAELAVGFFGSRYERATPAEREYLRAMAELTEGRDELVGTSGVADHLQRRASSLSPARDSLLKKGLVFSAQRGQIAFTVPHFGRYLLANGV